MINYLVQQNELENRSKKAWQLKRTQRSSKKENKKVIATINTGEINIGKFNRSHFGFYLSINYTSCIDILFWDCIWEPKGKEYESSYR